MNLYRVTRPGYKTQWGGSLADVSAIKAHHMESGAKRKDLTVEPVDVPTDKSGLMAWLNKEAANAPVTTA